MKRTLKVLAGVVRVVGMVVLWVVRDVIRLAMLGCRIGIVLVGIGVRILGVGLVVGGIAWGVERWG